MSEDCPFCLYEKTEENCPGCFEGSNYRPKPLTNADCIRAMTDEELAEWLFHAWHKSWYTLQEWNDWLKSPVEVDE